MVSEVADVVVGWCGRDQASVRRGGNSVGAGGKAGVRVLQRALTVLVCEPLCASRPGACRCCVAGEGRLQDRVEGTAVPGRLVKVGRRC